jgi:hypothetical protein
VRRNLFASGREFLLGLAENNLPGVGSTGAAARDAAWPAVVLG